MEENDEKRVNLTLPYCAQDLNELLVRTHSATTSVELTSRNLRIVRILKFSSLVPARLFDKCVRMILLHLDFQKIPSPFFATNYIS